jgi:hypothetical protein
MPTDWLCRATTLCCIYDHVVVLLPSEADASKYRHCGCHHLSEFIKRAGGGTSMKPYFKFFWPGILTLPAGGLFVLGLLTFGPRQASDMFYQRALIGGMLIVLGGFAFWKAIEFANAAHGSHTVRAIFAAPTAAVLILHGEFYILWPDWKLVQNPLAFSFRGPGKASWNLPSAVLVASNAGDIDGTYTVRNQGSASTLLMRAGVVP